MTPELTNTPEDTPLATMTPIESHPPDEIPSTYPPESTIVPETTGLPLETLTYPETVFPRATARTAAVPAGVSARTHGKTVMPEETIWFEREVGFEATRVERSTVAVRSTVILGVVSEEVILTRDRGGEEEMKKGEEEGRTGFLVVSVLLLLVMSGLFAFLMYTERGMREARKLAILERRNLNGGA
jgi:hypothetical protein